jgi:hypothetical protein
VNGGALKRGIFVVNVGAIAALFLVRRRLYECMEEETIEARILEGSGRTVLGFESRLYASNSWSSDDYAPAFHFLPFDANSINAEWLTPGLKFAEVMPGHTLHFAQNSVAFQTDSIISFRTAITRQDIPLIVTLHPVWHNTFANFDCIFLISITTQVKFTRANRSWRAALNDRAFRLSIT